ncbi:hypothetical protein MHBO_000004 [Bonamia ostreae]|uniref:MRG domain-containing protein n=1 Tax=Bonamia ostreae TaxID=126728 RepID=A0ABV2ADY6_9EUKA
MAGGDKTNVLSEMKCEKMFGIKEKVLVYFKGALYDARILKKNGDKRFKVHYLGWNKRWDENVDVSRIFPFEKEFEEIRDKIEKGQIPLQKEIGIGRTKNKKLEKKSAFSHINRERRSNVLYNKEDKKISNLSEEKRKTTIETQKSEITDVLRQMDSNKDKKQNVEKRKKPNGESLKNFGHPSRSLASIKSIREAHITFSPVFRRIVGSDFVRAGEKQAPHFPANAFTVSSLLERTNLNREQKKELANLFDQLMPEMLLFDFEKKIYLREAAALNFKASQVYGVTHLFRLLGLLVILSADIHFFVGTLFDRENRVDFLSS